MENIGLYIHIPFCKRKCFYCHFVKQNYDSDIVEKYIKALSKELQLHANRDYIIDSNYMGGGSPSLLNEKQISHIFETVHSFFKVNDSIECTFEMNPEDITASKLHFLKEAGTNRLSIGTQSFIPQDLEYLKRTHSVHQSLNAIELALNIGFNNINIDFIISLPTQTTSTLSENFSILKQFNISHVSAYILEEVEDGESKDIRDNQLYYYTHNALEEMGYHHYEISNFSKRSFSSTHNLKYWNNKHYIGAGLSASGFENGIDYKNYSQMSTYLKKIEAGFLPKKEIQTPNLKLRKIVMGLRLLDGISESYFDSYKKELEFMVSNGVLLKKNNQIILNPEKLLLLNEVLTYFFK